MIRVPIAAAVATVIAAIGIAGLIRGAVPQPVAGAQPGAPSSAVTEPITITDAYVREPAGPGPVAAYLTINNTTGTDDKLIAVASGASAHAEIHIDASMTGSSGLVIPAHSKVTLVAGKSHIMLDQLYGPITAGQTVNLELIFANAGGIVVAVPVIGVTAPAPTAAAPS
jgi:copper(I)-binding protein